MADNYTYKDAGGNTLTHASKELSAGVHASKHVLVDTAGTEVVKAEDAAHVSGDKGYMLLAVRQDTAAALAGADGDYIPLIVDAQGRLHITPQVSAGDVANDGVDSGNPVKIGGRASTATPTPVSADGDRVQAWLDRNGRIMVSEDQLRALLPASIGTKAKASSLAVALPTDQLDTDASASPVATQFPLGAYFQDLGNSGNSGIAAGNAGRLRMTQQRELAVAPRSRWAYGSNASIANMADLLVSTTNAYSGYAAATTGFFDGATFGAGVHYIRIPMFEFPRGALIGLYHNFGVDLTLNLRADITGQAASLSMLRPVIDTVVVSSGSSVWFSPFPVAAGADAAMRYAPGLNMPMYYATLQITPASAPAGGILYVAVSR